MTPIRRKPFSNPLAETLFSWSISVIAMATCGGTMLTAVIVLTDALSGRPKLLLWAISAVGTIGQAAISAAATTPAVPAVDGARDTTEEIAGRLRRSLARSQIVIIFGVLTAPWSTLFVAIAFANTIGQTFYPASRVAALAFGYRNPYPR